MTSSRTGRYAVEEALALRLADPADSAGYRAGLLRAHLRQAATLPFYAEMLRREGLSPDDFRDLAGLASLPFTTRADLDRDPLQFRLDASAEHRDIALTSGTTGEPVIVPYTAADLERLAFNETMAYCGAGIRPGDRVLLTCTLDRCFIAGLAYYSGLVGLGAAAIRSGPGQPAWQWRLIEKLRPRAIVGVPSFLLHLGEWGQAHGIDTAASGIRALVTIGEPIRHPDHSLNPVGQRLSELFPATICGSYGATELETAFCECTATCGGHVHPELMIVEVVDDEGRSVRPGQPGEVVVTPLGVEGFPLVRFRTGDVARLHDAPCPCGWRTPRLGAVEGRLAQRLKCRGTTLYPETVFRALQTVNILEAYLEITSAADLSDEISVIVGSDGELDREHVSEHLQAALRVRPSVAVRPLGEVRAIMHPEGGSKRRTVFDRRRETRS
jgi:phenylacetate-CoA ligase